MQGVPATVKDVGAGVLPVWVPLKPMSAVAPGASVAFHDAPLARTVVPVWAHVALQPCATR